MVVQIKTIGGTALGCHHAAGNTDHGGTRRHGLYHHRVGGNAGAVTDADWTQNLGAGTHHHAIADCRVALAGMPGGAAQGDAVVERDVFANLGRLADHHAIAVVDKEACANARTGVDVDLRDAARHKRNPAWQIAPAARPQRMGDAVVGDGMHAGVDGPGFEQVAGGRVALQHAVHVADQQGPPAAHSACPPVRGVGNSTEANKKLRSSSGVASCLTRMACSRMRASKRPTNASSSSTTPKSA